MYAELLEIEELLHYGWMVCACAGSAGVLWEIIKVSFH